MTATPTFVVGVGRVGVEVIRALHQHKKTQDQNVDTIRSICIDTDGERLRRLKRDGISTIYLDSDEYILSDDLHAYPFLAPDISVPKKGTNGLRHVGRYKLDSATSPTVLDVEDIIRNELCQFFKDCATSTVEFASEANVVLVNGLGDGTGGGNIPLLTGIIENILENIDKELYLPRLFGIGVVPPLDIDPELEVRTSDPVSYLNTYASMENLGVLFENDSAVEIPIYGSNRDEESDSYSTPGRTYTLSDNPYNAYWLISHSPQSDVGTTGTIEKVETPASICRFIQMLSAGALSDDVALYKNNSISALGTFGYEAVSVPHKQLKQFCELKKRRNVIDTKLDDFITPKIQSLCERREVLQSLLDSPKYESINNTEQMNRFRNWVGESESAPLEIFTHMGVEQFDQTLQELRDKWEPSAYYRMLIVLDEFIHDDVVPHLHEELENTISEIQQRYDIDTLTIGEANKRALSESVETIIDCVNERHDICEKRLEETNPDFRDILPSIINLFVGEKELLKKELYQIETDLDHLNNLQQDIKTVENIRTICEQRLEDTKESLESDLANCQEEIQYFQQRQDDRREELNTLDKRITTLRRELSTSQNYGGEHQLALSWESLDELTESKMAELTSLHAYLDKGLLSEDTARVKSAVVDCLERSRSYPDPLSRHTKPLPAVTTSQDIFIRYNEANEPLLNDIEDKLGISDKINLLSSNESRFKGDRYRIEAFSVFQGGNPTNLRGYERLNSSHKNGTLGAMAGHYRNPDRALAYPELHESLTTDEFNIDNNKNSK